MVVSLLGFSLPDSQCGIKPPGATTILSPSDKPPTIPGTPSRAQPEIDIKWRESARLVYYALGTQPSSRAGIEVGWLGSRKTAIFNRPPNWGTSTMTEQDASTLRHLLLTVPALEVRHGGMPAVHVFARFETTGLGAQRRTTRIVEHAMRNGQGPIATGGEHPWR